MGLVRFYDMKSCTIRRRVTVALVAVGIAGIAGAEFRPYQWAPFEDGKLPPGSVAFGRNALDFLKVVDLSAVTGMPAEFRGPRAVKETGRFAISLQASYDPRDYKTRLRGLGVGVVLDRDKLGATGRALYQADFFLPPGNEPLPELAVLAMEPIQISGPATAGETLTSEGPSRSFYRFGFVKNQNIYFSCVVPGEKDGTAAVFKSDARFSGIIPRPGWHRFAMMFEGPELIHCYVDARELSFSPIQDNRLKRLQVGFILAEGDPEKKYHAYIDNLSIQWSPEKAPVPESPYPDGWTIPPSDAGEVAQATVPMTPGAPTQVGGRIPSAASAGAGQGWTDDPKVAWADALRSKKPLLLYFHSPKTPNTERLNQIFASNPQAQGIIQKCASARVDANQLEGGTLATQYNIFKTPTILVFSPEGKELGRAMFGSMDTWETLAPKIGVK